MFSSLKQISFEENNFLTANLTLASVVKEVIEEKHSNQNITDESHKLFKTSIGEQGNRVVNNLLILIFFLKWLFHHLVYDQILIFFG